MDIPIIGLSIVKTKDLVKAEENRAKSKALTTKMMECLLHDVHEYKVLLERHGIDVREKMEPLPPKGCGGDEIIVSGQV